MKQACLEGTSPSLATMLYQSSRDCLELFLAIVPVRFADVIDTVPRMGAVLYNDCCYLAHNCTLITHMYKVDLGKVDKTLQENAGIYLCKKKKKNSLDTCFLLICWLFDSYKHTLSSSLI